MLKGKFERDPLPRGGEEAAKSLHSALKGGVGRYTIEVNKNSPTEAHQLNTNLIS